MKKESGAEGESKTPLPKATLIYSTATPRTIVPLLIFRTSVCVYVFYFLSRCMRPEGPWQRLAAALADSSFFYLPLYDRILSPTTMGYTGATLSPPSHAAFRTSVSSKNSRMASVKRESPNSLLIEQLPGLIFPQVPHTPKPLPFLLVLDLFSSVLPIASPDASPIFFHSFLIWSLQVLHSLKRCSRLCLPLSHHQH